MLAAVLLALPAASALACSCVPTTEDEAFARAAAVFTGTLVDYRPPPMSGSYSSMDPATWVFHVHEVHKGVVDQPRQEVASAVSSASCGLEPPDGQATYRVYADGPGEGGTLTASLCGGTQVVADQPVPDQVEEPTSAGDGDLRVTSQARGVLLALGASAGLVAVAGVAGVAWRRRRP